MTDRPADRPTDRPTTDRPLADLFGAARDRLVHGRASTNRVTSGATSDLSIDETLLLHSIGWEPVDMVVGSGVGSFPAGIFNWTNAGFAAPDVAARSFAYATEAAFERLRIDCSRAGGAGVISVEVELAVHPHDAEVTLVGTAVRPAGQGHAGRPFVSDLSTRDFCLLEAAGWEPLGLAFGTAFVQAPYRRAGQAFKQMGQNVELTNLTEALYEARELGMGRMQESALAMGADGVVAVKLIDRPLPFAKHVVGFTTWGTAIRLREAAHIRLRPQVVVSLDDPVRMFDIAAALGDG